MSSAATSEASFCEKTLAQSVSRVSELCEFNFIFWFLVELLFFYVPAIRTELYLTLLLLLVQILMKYNSRADDITWTSELWTVSVEIYLDDDDDDDDDVIVLRT